MKEEPKSDISGKAANRDRGRERERERDRREKLEN